MAYTVLPRNSCLLHSDLLFDTIISECRPGGGDSFGAFTKNAYIVTDTMDIITIGIIVAFAVCLIAGKHEKNKEEKFWKSQGREKVKIGNKWYWI